MESGGIRVVLGETGFGVELPEDDGDGNDTTADNCDDMAVGDDIGALPTDKADGGPAAEDDEDNDGVVDEVGDAGVTAREGGRDSGDGVGCGGVIDGDDGNSGDGTVDCMGRVADGNDVIGNIGGGGGGGSGRGDCGCNNVIGEIVGVTTGTSDVTGDKPE